MGGDMQEEDLIVGIGERRNTTREFGVFQRCFGGIGWSQIDRVELKWRDMIFRKRWIDEEQRYWKLDVNLMMERERIVGEEIQGNEVCS